MSHAAAAERLSQVDPSHPLAATVLVTAVRDMVKESVKGEALNRLRRALYPEDRSGSQFERLAIATLDDDGRVLEVEILSTGGPDQTSACHIHILRWLRSRPGSPRRFALAHNHPSGTALPSGADMSSARALAEVAALMGLELVHDLVITLTGSFDALDVVGPIPTTQKQAFASIMRQRNLASIAPEDFLCRADRLALSALRANPRIRSGDPFHVRGQRTTPAIAAPCTRATLDRLARLGAIEALPRSPGQPARYRLSPAQY